MMPNISFGERVRRARIRNAMTQTELAKKFDVSQGTIFNWEKGNSIPSAEQKARLKKVLGNVWTESKTENHEEPASSQPSSFGSWLNRSRIERGLSVPELAEKAKLSAAAIYNIEAGRISNPRQATVQRLEHALGTQVPTETKNEIREEATIEDVGELVDFDPHDEGDLPTVPGIYVLYDISERPIYVGPGSDIKRRIKDHSEKFWYRQPIVDTGAFVKIDEKGLREKVETLLIRFLKSNAVINKQNVDR
jgi:transcriptional regulator with XRE-family HTH domain